MRLSEKDKYAIRGMKADGKSVDEIKRFLGKSKNSRVVEKYLDEENVEVLDQVSEFVSRLNELGVDAIKAVELLEGIETENKTSEELKEEVVSKAKTKQLIKNKSEKGRSGVTVMTQPASERSDDARKRMPSSKPDYLWKRN